MAKLANAAAPMMNYPSRPIAVTDRASKIDVLTHA
jgi:hypothetical protein